MKEIPLLEPRQIDVRVQQLKEQSGKVYAICLLYKDARVDMEILDEVFGSMNWQRKHTRDNANCIISVWDNDKNYWVEKEDTGKESFSEAEKGLASDSFKRAGFNWGIGRELYTSPFIWLELKDGEHYKDNKGNTKTNTKFKLHVSDIDYNKQREITFLEIQDTKGEVRYSFPKKKGNQ